MVTFTVNYVMEESLPLLDTEVAAPPGWTMTPSMYSDTPSKPSKRNTVYLTI